MTDRYTVWLSQQAARDDALLSLFAIAAACMGLWFVAGLFPVPIAYYMRRMFGALMVIAYVVLFAVALFALVGPALAPR